MKRKRLLIILYSVAFVLAIAAAHISLFNRGYNEIAFVDVGQGDASLITTDRGHAILIDGGDKGSGKYTLSRYLKLNNCNDVDAAFISHMHDDHYLGIAELLEQGVFIKKIYISENAANTKGSEEFLRLADKRGCKIIRLNKGSCVDIDNVKIHVLYDGKAESKEKDNLGYEKEDNENSMILRAEVDGVSILYTGDATKICERMIMDDPMTDTDILKVGHHGSSTSTGDGFLDKVTPEFAVISVGKDNIYNLPSDKTVDRLKESKIPILRTDDDGTVVIRVSDDDILDIDVTRQEESAA